MNLQGRNIFSWVASAARPATRFVIISPFFRVNMPIESLLNSVRALQIIVGDEFSINDPRPLRRLSKRASRSVTYIDTKEFGSRLHAKVFYAAEPSGRRRALVGSANFTVSGLTKSEEQAVSFDSDCKSDRPLLREIELWIDELAKSACDIDWNRAERQYQGSPDPNHSSDGFDTYLRHRAQNFWVLKTTAGSAGRCYWPEFIEERVISIGWDDIVRIIGDEAGLEPHEYTYEALYAAAVQSIDRGHVSGSPHHAANMLHCFSRKFSTGDRIIVCNGYNSGQKRDVRLFGLAIVDGDARDDRPSDWWRLKRPAVLEPMEIDLPKDVFVTTLGKRSLRQTIHRVTEQQYESFSRRCRGF